MFHNINVPINKKDNKKKPHIRRILYADIFYDVSSVLNDFKKTEIKVAESKVIRILNSELSIGEMLYGFCHTGIDQLLKLKGGSVI